MFPDLFISDLAKKLALKGAFWHFAKFKTTSINVVVNGAFEIIDVSNRFYR